MKRLSEVLREGQIMTDNEAELTSPSGETTPAGEPPPVLTAQEVADLLRVSYRVVITLAKTGEIPAFMVAGQWRFLKKEVEAWLQVMSRKGYQGPELPDQGNYDEV